LTITTTRRTSVWPRLAPPSGGPKWLVRPGLLLLWGMALLGLLALRRFSARPTRRSSWLVLALAALWLASFAACGAGGTGYVNPTGTPSGTYTVSVTGVSQGLSHAANLTLSVQ
jgi:peptidoglycan/LPS O-acetylase OafA/YrhL